MDYDDMPSQPGRCDMTRVPGDEFAMAGHDGGGSSPELHWVGCALESLQRMQSGQYAQALEACRRMGELSGQFDAADPRRAASLNNLGAGLHLAGDVAAAERAYREADAAWQRAAAWVAAMQPARRARSSLFHLRLEGRHRATYARLARDQSAQLLAAGQATTLNNLGEILHAAGDRRAAAGLYERAAEQRRAVGGTGDEAAGVIAANLAVASGEADGVAGVPVAAALGRFAAVAARNGWLVDRPPRFSDEGRLAAAVMGAVAIAHRRGS